ncbi:MAG: molybdopterin-dependent oxidoreductase [Desulfomonile tiedjei]|uniref:Molybdopterin-dependent oxidoreductase n=1 Tax=Desulfomonile tiedjei TaxID=2358 RepID=A0A9D6V5I7_9BACT|nr:molybdopterin-dependent oxidoreductase [Desulfomonile tiedjei]
MTDLTRREFVRLATLMGGVSLFAGCTLLQEPQPVPKYSEGAPSVDALETIAGVRNVYSVCGACPGNCGICCRVAEGTVVKIGGNPYHPVSADPVLPFDTSLENAITSAGAVCALGGSGIQTLYDPFRIAKPLKRVGPRGSGKWSGITWEQAFKEILEGGDLFGEGKVYGLREIKESGHGLGFLVGRADWGALTFLSGFVGAFPGAVMLRDREILPQDVASAAAETVFGPGFGPVEPDYRNAGFVLSFADAPLDSGIPLVSVAREIADSRVGGRGMKWAVVDPRLSTSGSKADMWVPVIPGKDLELVCGIMRSLVNRHPGVKQIPDESLRRTVQSRSVAQFSEECGITVEAIDHLADMMVQAGAKSAAMPGRGILSGKNGKDVAAAVYTLNLLVGSVPGSGGLLASNDGFLQEAHSKMARQPQQTSSDKRIRALLTWNADPAYTDPSVAEMLADRADPPLFIAIDRGITETTICADYILPDTTYLERWDVCTLPPSVNSAGFGVRRPVVGGVDPKTGKYFPILPDIRIMEDIVAEIAGRLTLQGFEPPDKDAAKTQNASNYYKKLVSVVLESMKSSGFQVPASLEEVDKVMDRGGIFFNSEKVVPRNQKPIAHAATRYWPEASASPSAVPEPEDGLLLITYSLPFHRTPDYGLNSWLLEVLPENCLAVNSQDARRLGIRQNDSIKVESADGKIVLKCKAQVLPGIRPGIVALARGFGYKQSGVSRQIIDGIATGDDRTRGAGVNPAVLTSKGALKVRVKKT